MRNSCAARLFLVITVLVIGASIANARMAQGVFGPETYERRSGPPQTFMAVFQTPEASALTLRVANGDSSGDHRVSAARIWLNDDEVLHPSDLSQDVEEVVREVSSVAGNNTLRVWLAGRPGGRFTLELFADGGSPALTITAPEDSETLSERTVDVHGVVSSAPALAEVRLGGFEGSVAPDGTFVIPLVPLEDLETELVVQLVLADDVLAEDRVVVHYVRPAEASAIVTPTTGATIEVDNPSSPLFGASLVIEAGAATRTLQACIVSEPEHVPNLPVGVLAVGPAVLFGPEAETFAVPVTATIPYDALALPSGADEGDLFVLGLADSGWEPVTADSIAGGRAVLHLTSFERGPFVVVVRQPLGAGEILVSSIPANATIYLDRTDTGLRTPALLTGTLPGVHELKLYLSGFNEAFVPVTLVAAQGILSETTLGTPGSPAPVITLGPGVFDGMVVSTSFLDVAAQVTFDGQPLASGVAVLSSDGKDTFEAISAGVMQGALALDQGENLIQVRVTGPNGNTGVTPTLRVTRTEALVFQGLSASRKGARQRHRSLSSGVRPGPRTIIFDVVEGQEIQVRLSWNTDTTDIDLHTFDPDGAHSWYGDLDGIPGGSLDRDDVDGFGPEVFTMPSPRSGTYRVAVDSYRIDDISTRASLVIHVGGESIFSENYLFTSDDFNATDGTGPSNAAFWNAHEFEIRELEIVSIETVEESPEEDAIFTTDPAENRVTLTVEGPDSLADEDIHFEVEEVRESFALDTDEITGRTPVIELLHRGLVGLTNPRHSRKLEYSFVAFTLDDSGNRDLESRERKLRQEVRSQIRQEYVDKRDFNSGFVRATPDREDIIDASQFHRQPGEFFGFNEFAIDSDFGPALAVIGDSRQIANTVRAAWGFPLRLTSGWRNPRNNDSLTPDSVLNSFHQTGDAVDLNPSRNSAQWPATCPCCGSGISTYAQAQTALTCTARSVLDLNVHDTRFHANHLHIERDPGGGPGI